MPPTRERQIEKSKLILVEGNDEDRFFRMLLKSMEIQDVQVWPYFGKDKLRQVFPVLLLDPRFKDLETYAIFRDADDNPNTAFQSIRDLLKRNSQPWPPAPGTFTNGSPRVGVYIIPDSTSAGMLEDLCLRAVEGHSVMPCVTAFMDCLRGLPSDSSGSEPVRAGSASFPINQAKAKFYAFLAATHAGRRLGEAFEAGAWEDDHRALEPIRAFLTKL
jgi:hypothetical protein